MMAIEENLDLALPEEPISTDDFKITTCRFCDGGCALKAWSGHVEPLDPALPAICSKAVRYQEIIGNEKRLVLCDA